MSKIDVIIPCYKARDTIAKTLHSIAMQSIAEEVKVYIINDCDGLYYDDILYNFPELDIRYIKRDSNGGCGAARNTGIKNSTAEYITFIDADDCFTNCLALEIMLCRIKATKADMLVSVFEGELRFENGIGVKKIEHSPTWMHGKLLRRQFLIDNNLLFNESLRLNEDVEFNQILIDSGVKTTEISMPTLLWRDNPNSVTHESLYKNKRVFIDAVSAYIKDCEGRNIDKKIFTHRVLQNLVVIYQYYNIVLDENADMADDYLSACKDYWKLCEPIVADVEDEHITKVFASVMKGYSFIPDITFVQFLNEIKE